MTAEIEDQEKKGEKGEVIDLGKAPSPKDEKPVENGSDLKQPEKAKDAEDAKEEDGKVKDGEDKKVEAAEEKEEEEIEVKPKKRGPSFFDRIFRRNRQDMKQDPEAGTELLSKEEKAVEIIKPAEEVDGKAEGKEGSGTTDVTVVVEDEKKEAGEAKADQKRSYWKRVSFSLVAILVVLAVVTVISVLTNSGRNARGPLGEPLVVTDCGPIRGFRDSNGMYIFKGIPYSLAPVGDLRWKPPMHASNYNDCWTGTYEAYNSSAICYQKPILGLNLEMSEDCLYLDILTPSLTPPVLRPVVVYFPGDHPLKGHTAADIQWRPSSEVADEQDVTFVTVNYRTNIFGFAIMDLLANRERPPTSGNYGVMDMQAALKWIKLNILSFGGDPDKVTVLAHGGGATAALALLSSKKSDSLFSQMWLTAPSAHLGNKTLSEMSEANIPVLRKLNCDSVTCLLNKSPEELLAAVPGYWYSDWSVDLPTHDEEQHPIISVADGYVLYNNPYAMWQNGDVQQVPVVIGSAAQESGSSKLLHDLDKWSWSDFSEFVSEKLEVISENATAAALQFYIRNSSTPRQQFHTMVSDVRTICPLEHLNSALSDALQTDLYWYLVDYSPSSAIQFSNESAPARMSVHGLDIVSIFGLLDQYINPLAQEDMTFQKNLQDLFYSFVYKGRPQIRGETLMSWNFINLIGESVRSKMAPYEDCHLWNNEVFFPQYAKMN